jgi:hypothetical protein
MAAKWTDFVSGAVLEAAQLNSVLDNFQDMAIFNETQAANTSGGTFTSGAWTKRTLNTTIINNIGATLTTSVIALPAGTYYIHATAPAADVGRHKLRLQNTTDATTTLVGNSASAANTLSAILQTDAQIRGTFIITGTKNFEIQHYCAVTANTRGLGVESNFGVSEIYTIVQIVRIA